MASWMQIGLEVHQTERAHQGGSLALDLQLFLGTSGSRFVALSSVEAEYMAASQAACEAIWMRKILVGLFGSQMDPTMIHCDNQRIALNSRLILCFMIGPSI